MESYDALVETLYQRGYADKKTADAMRQCDRRYFVNDHPAAYEDRPLPIGEGQTISAPSVVALMTTLLDVHPGEVILEVGTGSGWQAAILATLGARVISIERHPSLVIRARENIARCGKTIRIPITILEGDGTLGAPDYAPFDKIIITAASPRIPPPLFAQLKEGGRIVAPVGSRIHQTLVVGEKHYTQLEIRESIDVVFVPLIGVYGFRGEEDG